MSKVNSGETLESQEDHLTSPPLDSSLATPSFALTSKKVILVMLVFVIPFLLILYWTSQVSNHEIHAIQDSWDYTDQEAWKVKYPSCGGNRQSPINIEDACFPSSKTRLNDSLQINLLKYHVPLPKGKITLKNNGHTAKMTLAGTTQPNNWSPKISGSAVNNNVYQFNELHFHWDQNDTSGSEHSIHGSRQALEMHLVHWNVKYGSMEAAAAKPDGLAVVAILFGANIEDNSAMSPIIDYLDDVIFYDSQVAIGESFTLKSLLPESFQIFYKYKGSLTTPPCSQSVDWILVTQVQKISYAQLNEFTQLDNRENRLFGNTNRILQPLNDRIVQVSSDRHCKRQQNEKDEKKKRKQRLEQQDINQMQRSYTGPSQFYKLWSMFMKPFNY